MTDEEYARLAAAATGRGFSEWVRDALLAATVSSPIDRLLLAEFIAIRAIVLTLHVAIGSGETVSPDAFQHLVERADRDKFGKAEERIVALLRGFGARSSS